MSTVKISRPADSETAARYHLAVTDRRGHSLNYNAASAPRKRLRGRRRYSQRVLREAHAYQPRVGPSAWWDYWHYHADWPGWGNRGWSHRRQHLEALCVVFRNIAARKHEFATPFQTWIMVDGEDAHQDATDLHTPNANGTPFPCSPDNIVVGGTALADEFQRMLPEFSLHCGWNSWLDDSEGLPRPRTAHWIWAQDVGVPLWQSD